MIYHSTHSVDHLSYITWPGKRKKQGQSIALQVAQNVPVTFIKTTKNAFFFLEILSFLKRNRDVTFCVIKFSRDCFCREALQNTSFRLKLKI